MMFDYLRGRPTLRRVMLLLDARIEVKAGGSSTVMELLDRAAVTYQVVLTKADGLKPVALAQKAGRGAAVGTRASGGASGRGRDQQRERGGGLPSCGRRLRRWWSEGA